MSIEGLRDALRIELETSALRGANPAETQRLFERLRFAGTGSTGVFGTTHQLVGGMMVMQDVDELLCLILALRRLKERKRKRGEPFRYLEIGSGSGGTAKLLHEEVGFDQMVAIDHPQPDVCELKRKHFSEFPISHFEGDSGSFEAVQWLVSNRLGPFDVVFIDGDHRAVAALRDIFFFRAFCTSGAVMVFHDTIVVHADISVRLALDLSYAGGWLTPIAQYRGPTPHLGVDLALVT